MESDLYEGGGSYEGGELSDLEARLGIIAVGGKTDISHLKGRFLVFSEFESNWDRGYTFAFYSFNLDDVRHFVEDLNVKLIRAGMMDPREGREGVETVIQNLRNTIRSEGLLEGEFMVPCSGIVNTRSITFPDQGGDVFYDPFKNDRKQIVQVGINIANDYLWAYLMQKSNKKHADAVIEDLTAPRSIHYKNGDGFVAHIINCYVPKLEEAYAKNDLREVNELRITLSGEAATQPIVSPSAKDLLADQIILFVKDMDPKVRAPQRRLYQRLRFIADIFDERYGSHKIYNHLPDYGIGSTATLRERLV